MNSGVTNHAIAFNTKEVGATKSMYGFMLCCAYITTTTYSLLCVKQVKINNNTVCEIQYLITIDIASSILI